MSTCTAACVSMVVTPRLIPRSRRTFWASLGGTSRHVPSTSLSTPWGTTGEACLRAAVEPAPTDAANLASAD
eukprot:5043634-Alexandrium_andersonii.AAC.1